MNRIVLLVPSILLLATSADAQWSTPVNMTNLNSSGTDFYPSPTFDGLTLYFSSDRTANADIYRATRTAPYTAFGTPTLVTELNDPAADYAPCTRIDHLEIFFFSGRPGGGGGSDLWRADRASTSVPFNAPVPVSELNTATEEWSPSLSLDGLRIYFASNRAGGTGSYDIWTAVRPSWGSPFGTATPVTELNSIATDRDPRISPDGLTIFFASQRVSTSTGSDLYVASRLDPASPFGNVTNIAALNTSVPDFTPGFAVYYDELFFCSQRPGGLGVNDLWTARFTGLLGVGIASAGLPQNLRFSDPSSPGRVYVAASSRGNSPGIPIDTRTLPLNFDLLLQLTVGGLPPILTGYVGALDQDGIASGSINFAGFAQLVGLRFFSAFLVLDPSAPSGIKTISNAHEVLV